MMILQLASILSRGDKLPCDDTEREPIRVIYQTAEDGLGDTIKPRLVAANADCTQIKVIDELEAALSMLVERIEQAIIETGAKVIILDPVQAYIGAQIDMNRANEVRNVFSQLGRVAEKHGCAVILVGHLNKVQGGKANYRGLGSIDFQATARSVLIVGRLKENKEVRVVVHEKSSLAPEGDPIAFELSKETGFVWKGSVNHNSRKFKAENVDGERSHFNVDYCNENIKKVYHKLFDEALQRYNEKQTRADRRIADYYEKIRNSKQEKPFHELILQIGDKENMGAGSENGQLARQILDEYYHGFQERNPNLYVFSAHIHMDEATPHLHIDFVPFTTGSKRGLDTRISCSVRHLEVSRWIAF